jgi:magnesium-transporting ATPase (P-type)
MATLALTLLVGTFPGLSEKNPFWRMGRSLTPPFWFALAGGLCLQVVALHWAPLASVLLTEPLSPSDWLRVLGMALVALAAVEAGKAFAARNEPLK